MTAVRKPKPINQAIIEPVMSAMIDYNSNHFQPAIIKMDSIQSSSNYLIAKTIY